MSAMLSGRECSGGSELAVAGADMHDGSEAVVVSGTDSTMMNFRVFGLVC